MFKRFDNFGDSNANTDTYSIEQQLAVAAGKKTMEEIENERMQQFQIPVQEPVNPVNPVENPNDPDGGVITPLEFNQVTAKVDRIPDEFLNKGQNNEPQEPVDPELPDESIMTAQDFFKNQATLLADKYGFKVEFNEDFVWDEESYTGFTQDLISKVADENSQSFQKQIYSKDDRVGKLFEAIATDAEPETVSSLIENLQKEHSFQSIDTSTEEGRIQFLRKFYTDIKGMPSNLTEKNLKSAQIDGSLDDHFKYAEEQYSKHFESEREEITKRENKARENQLLELKERKDKVTKNLVERQDLTNTEKTNIYSTLFAPSEINPKLTKFDDVMLNLQKTNPEQLIDIIHFIQDPDKFIKLKSQGLIQKAVEDKFTRKSNVTQVKVATKPQILSEAVTQTIQNQKTQKQNTSKEINEGEKAWGQFFTTLKTNA